MQRIEFIKLLLLQAAVMSAGNTIASLGNVLPENGEMMPVLFIGHGNPMNGIENNSFSREWESLGKKLPKPTAVLVISAHWLTKGTHITAMEQPRTIHDFGGFPKELYSIEYPTKGNPVLAKEIKSMLTTTNAGLDHEWGLDHGSWTILRRVFPNADIPVLQLSIDYPQSAQYHYDLAMQLKDLRKRGVLIIGSGNLIHNLRMVDFGNIDKVDYGYDWAVEMHNVFKEKIIARDYKALINYEQLGSSAKLAIPTPDHYYPLMYVLALTEKNEKPEFFNDHLVAGSLNMTSICFGA